MAPNLPKIKRVELQNVIVSKLNGEEKITDTDIGKTIIRCSPKTVRNARSNYFQYGSIDAPGETVGRPKKITDNMWLAVKAKNDETSGMNQQAIVNFLWTAFRLKVDRSTVSREIKRRDWSGRVPQVVAKERDEDLRDDFIERRSKYDPNMMVCVDESGCDRSLAMPKKVYGPKGVRPVRAKRFHRGKRVQILPAYTIDGVIYCEVYEENTDVNVFEGFIERLLPFCGRFPQPRSVIFMDNASFHFSKRIEQMIANAGVILEYSSPYSPDLMPIEHYFGSLKNIIRSKAQDDEDLIRGDFKSYIEMQIGMMQEDEESARRMARGHFRLAGIYIEEE
jgi:transposase